MRLSDSDLRFVVETVAPERQDPERVVELLRGKEDLQVPLLEDPRLVERLLNEHEALVRVSPYLLFAVLLRRLRRDLESRTFVLEADAQGRRLPVFAAREAAGLLDDPDLREYLIELLCSFVRTHSGTLYWRERGVWRKRRFSDLNLDDLIALCQLVETQFRPPLYKRAADLALFLAGIYPDYGSLRRPVRRLTTGGRTLPEYEREGRRLYTLAAREPAQPWPATVFETMAEQFTLAREVLNTLSEQYLKPLRKDYFGPAPN
jgi:hypothetical protein